MGKVTITAFRYLGVTLQSLSRLLREHLNLEDSGVAINQLSSNSPLATFGIRKNDIVIEVNGETIKDINTMISVFRTLEKGKKVKIKLIRKGKPETLSGSWAKEDKVKKELPANQPRPDTIKKAGK